MSAHRLNRIPTISFAMASLTLATLAVSGCATGNLAPTSVSPTANLQVSGTMMGGSAAIVGANIIIWETDPNNTGYPSATNEKAVVKAGSLTAGSSQVLTSSTGSFSVANSFTCDAGTFLYLTGTGGTTTGNTGVNDNLVLISAMGPCANFPSSNTGSSSTVHVALNEATTIATAYALGNFIYVDNTNLSSGLQAVYIGAPAKNAATTGSCSGTGSAMTCTSAGLSHAFQNALNVVNSVAFGSEPSGFPNSTLSGNSLAYIPVAQVNMLANVLEYCTNSTGGFASATGGVSDGTHCGNVFANTKSVSCAASSCSPQDTLTAAIDMGENPEHNIANLYSYTSGLGNAFNPSLSATPQNMSIPITYIGSSSTAFLSPTGLALDANDNVYVLTGDLPTATKSAVFSMTANGSPRWTTGFNTTYCAPGAIATDTVGNVWFTNNATSTQCGTVGPALVGVSQSAGTASSATTFTPTTGSPLSGVSQPNGVAIDQYNNVWFDSSSTTGGVAYIAYSGGSATGGTYGTTATYVENSTSSGFGSYGEILLDGSQNVYVSTTGGTSTSTPQATYVFPNQSAATYATGAAPSYTQNTQYNVQQGGGSGYSYGLAIDGSGDLWDENSNGGTALTAEYIPTKTNGVITALPSTPTTSFTSEAKVFESQFDGGGQLIYNYGASSGEFYFVANPQSPSNKGIVPCYIATASATTCSTTLPLVSNHGLQIDSTGAVWVSGLGAATTGTGNGGVVQVLGLAKPAWPQLSYGHFSAAPQ